MKLTGSCKRRLLSAALFTTTTLASAAILAVRAHAQDKVETTAIADPEAKSAESATRTVTDEREEIVVTARLGGQVAVKSPTGLLGVRDRMDVPFSTTSVTDQLIRDLQAHSLAEVLANDPSVRTTNDRFNYADQVTIRGFPLSASEATLNGLGGIVPTRRLPYESIERVDLIRGPVGLLVGNTPGSGIAGSLNYVTKKAGREPVTRLTGSYYSDANFGGAIDVSRRLGGSDGLGIRMNAAYRDGDTPLDGQKDRAGTASVNLDYTTGGFNLSIDAGYFDQYLQGLSPAVFVAAGASVPAPPDIRSTIVPSWQRSSVKGYYGMARARYDFTDGIYLTAAYGRLFNKEITVQNILVNLQTNGDVTAITLAAPQRRNFESADIQLHAKFETGPISHDLALIGNRISYQEGGPQTRFGAPSLQNIYRPFTIAEPDISGIRRRIPRQLDNVLSSFAAADIMSALDGHLQLLLGARLQRIKTDQFFGADPNVPTSQYAKSKLTPAYALIVKPVDQVALYANYIEGLVQGPIAPTAAANAGQQFAPTAASQYEAGVKFDSEGLAAQLSYFQVEQQTGYTDPTTNIFGILGLQRNTGFEAQLFGEPVKGFRITGGASTLKARVIRSLGGALNGKDAPASPEFQFTIAPEVDLPFAPGLTLSGRITHTGDFFVNPQNTQRVPSWTTFDIGARFKVPAGDTPLTIRANVDNLTNKNAWLTRGAGGLARSTPRTFRLSVEAAF
jgi:iron complex outermembrane receptor protein